MVKRASFVLVIFVALSLSVNGGKINIKFPTIGGKLFWTDVKIVKGWRVQQNLVTGHYRLLNPCNVRHAWGSRDDCLKKISQKVSVNKTAKTVILIHGLGLRKRSLKYLQAPLEKEGYQVVNFGYSTFFESIEDTSNKLASVLEDYQGDLYFVTHSMGGILLRHHLQENPRGVKGVAMLAVPNKGAEIVDFLKNKGLDSLLGMNGKRLNTDCDGLPHILSEPKAPFITVAGVKKNFFGYFPQFFLVPEDNDGIVSESSTQLSNSLAHYKVGESHFNIMKSLAVRDLILRFFEEQSEFLKK